MKQFFLDALDNIKHGLIAMWTTFTPVMKASIIASCTGFLFGCAVTLALVC